MRLRILSMLVAAVFLVGGALTGPAPVAADSEPPYPCDMQFDGDQYIDSETSMIFECIQAEFFGQLIWMWFKLGPSTTDSLTYHSPSIGCVVQGSSVKSTFGVLSSGGSMVQSFWAGFDSDGQDCDSPLNMSPGLMRARTLMSRWTGSSWAPCVDTGYVYNPTSARGWFVGKNMGSSPDCGAGTYRTTAYGGVYLGNLWRGTSILSPGLWMQ